MKRTYWIVRNDWTDAAPSFAHKRQDSITKFCKWYDYDRGQWQKLRKEGWRCEKVELKAVK